MEILYGAICTQIKNYRNLALELEYNASVHLENTDI